MGDSVQLILASGSQRRQQFFHALGLDFEVKVADIDETPYPEEKPDALTYRLAEEKAQAVAGTFTDGLNRLIIAADTVGGLGDEILGKPIDAQDAKRILIALRGQPHQVYSGISILSTTTGEQHTHVNATDVVMRMYTDAEIDAYIATGDPFDKAGAYAIQHPIFAPVQALQGCPASVMGLPLADLQRLFAQFGVSILKDISSVCEQHVDFPCCQRKNFEHEWTQI